MITEDLVELQFDSLRRLELNRQHLVILRDPQTKQGLPIPLTATEADALEVAFRALQYGNELPFPQDTSQRLLESLGAKFQRVVITRPGKNYGEMCSLKWLWIEIVFRMTLCSTE